MCYQVFHAINPNYGFGEPPQFPSEYELVANVETTELEDVFRLTNHIEWEKNSQVEEVKPSRSTSVGDIVVDATGHAFLCERIGWKEIAKTQLDNS